MRKAPIPEFIFSQMKVKEMKALIVDDEIYSIRAIKSAVDWERIGINEVLTAFDARSGRRMCM